MEILEVNEGGIGFINGLEWFTSLANLIKIIKVKICV